MNFHRSNNEPIEKYVFIERLMMTHGFVVITSVICFKTLFITSFIQLHSAGIESRYRDNFSIGAVVFALFEIWLLYAMRRNFLREQKEIIQSQQSLKLSEERLNLAVNGMTDGLWDWDIVRKEIYYSPRFMALTGHEPFELPYTIETFTNLVHPDDLPRVHAALRNHFKSHGNYRIEYRLRHKAGHYVWCQARGQAEWDSNGRAIRMTGFTMDVSEHKIAEANLLEARAEAERATKLKSEFLANMSHELRTPMNGVIGMSQLLLSGNLPPKDREYAQTILQSAEDLLYLLNDILDLSKIEAGKIELEHIPFDLYELCEDVREIIKPKAIEKNIELLLDYNPNDKRFVYGDPGRVRQILLNLVANAVKFTDGGTIEISIMPKMIPPNRVEFFCEVRDSGIGIPEDKQDYIFNKFSQADGTTTRKFGGTGLGLAICKDLCRMMGGTIGVRSKLGEGSTFWFTMVLEKDFTGRKSSVSASLEPQALKEARLAQKKGFDKNTALNNVRILLAEDNLVNQRVAVKMLEKYGCEVVAVHNGQQALSNFKHSGPFDLILMDCQMPIMDGYEATTMIRELERKYGWAHMPVVAFTAHALKGDDQKCYQAGMDDYMTKPIITSELERILMRWISSEKRIDCVHKAEEIEQAAIDDAIDDKIFMRFYQMVEDEMESLIESHRQATRDYFNTLRISLETKDFSEISKAAHTIKSSHANLGAMKTVQLAREIETHARTESPDIKKLRELTLELEKETHRVNEAITRKMSNG